MLKALSGIVAPRMCVCVSVDNGYATPEPCRVSVYVRLDEVVIRHLCVLLRCWFRHFHFYFRFGVHIQFSGELGHCVTMDRPHITIAFSVPIWSHPLAVYSPLRIRWCIPSLTKIYAINNKKEEEKKQKQFVNDFYSGRSPAWAIDFISGNHRAKWKRILFVLRRGKVQNKRILRTIHLTRWNCWFSFDRT